MPDVRRADSSIGTFERILHLKRLPMLKDLPAELLGIVAEQLQERSFAAGERLLAEGETEASVHFLVHGRVRVARRGRLLSNCGPGAAIGGIGVLARERSNVEATAIGDALTLELDGEAVQEIFEDHYALLHHMMTAVARQLLELIVATPQAAMALPRTEWDPKLGRDLDLVERILFLRASPVFRHASVNALAELSRGLTEIHFEPGMTLWNVGEASNFVLLIASGEVACTLADGRTAFSAGPGTPLGSIDAVAERPRWFDAVTSTNVVALHASIEGLLDIFEDNYEMATDYLEVVSRAVVTILDQRVARGDSLENFVSGAEPMPTPPAPA
jgi:CRP-like cAMP-binding protein